MEPKILKNGKKFEKIVKKNFSDFTKDGSIKEEYNVKIKKINGNSRSGRIDIFIEELGDYVTILEIKNTNWNRIAEKNIRKNLYKHQRQLFKYIENFMEGKNINVCHGIIYPEPPMIKERKEYIEDYMLNHYYIPVYWYNEIESK